MIRPGRHGLADGPPGVVVTSLPDPSMAAIALRRGAATMLAERLSVRFGLALPMRPGCAAAGGMLLVWAGVGQWLALRHDLSGIARFDFKPELEMALGGAASVTELTGSRALVRVTGPRVRDTLAKLLPLDLEASAFPPGSAALTNGGYMPVHVWQAEPRVFHLACYRSYGATLMESIVSAGAEYGCDLHTAAAIERDRRRLERPKA
jgi:sarcosine oxidase subunit gamma